MPTSSLRSRLFALVPLALAAACAAPEHSSLTLAVEDAWQPVPAEPVDARSAAIAAAPPAVPGYAGPGLAAYEPLSASAIATIQEAEAAPVDPQAEELPVVDGSEAGTPGWSYRFMPYLWAVNVSGDVRANNQEQPIDSDFSDIFDNFNGGGSLFFEAEKGRISLLADLTYIRLEAEEAMGPVLAEAETTTGLLGLDGAYQLAEDSPFDGILGLRLLDVENEITLSPPGGGPSGSVSAAHAVLGVRGAWKAGKRWEFRARGDVGFGNGTSWQLLGNAGYWVGEHWGFDVGYRFLGIDIDDGGTEADLVLDGLLVGLVFGW